MKRAKRYPGWRPTTQQELVLRAALSQGDDVVAAWSRLNEGGSLDSLDSGSVRLLPLLYHNLNAHRIEGPTVAALKEEYVRTWCDNQLLFHAASNLVRILHAYGIETLLLKGIALALNVYEDGGLRPMTDFDLLIRPEKAALAVKLLSRAGWVSKYESPEALIPFEHAVEFRNADGVRCDLHWRVLFDGRQEVTDDSFWQGAVNVDVGGVQTLVLNPADQLLHVCVHGVAWNDMPSVRWVADASMILRTVQPDVDWGRLAAEVRTRRLMLPMSDTLGYLSRRMGAQVPPDVLETIRGMEPSHIERALHRIRTGPSKPLKRLSAIHYWFNALRLFSVVSSSRHALLAFLKYLKALWGAEHLWQVPFQLVFRGARGVTQMIFAPAPDAGSGGEECRLVTGERASRRPERRADHAET